MADFGANLKRLMARFGLTIDEVVQQTGLDERTVKGILGGSIRRPHARTLHRLAVGLGVPADELFQNPALLAHRLLGHRSFDRQTNPVVDEVTASRPELFEGWTADDFDELYSHFGAGGELTEEGALRTVEAMNRRRDLHRKVAVVLESHEASLLEQMIDVLYRRIVIAEPEEPDRAAVNGELMNGLGRVGRRAR
ncbi:MAG: helix-turn-helix domain-containing protein [Gemmataceae bacterium]|nr:helix-turn-helix domain-containing protein [Gemmataceae bacterium]